MGLVIPVAQHSNIQRSIFKAYDIRGVVGENFGEEQAYTIGCALAQHYRNNAITAVGRDGRLSSPAIAAALIRGLNTCGVDTIEIGAVPTPVLYFAAYQHAEGSGLMITGSHNPAQYNGIKIMICGHTLAGDDMQILYEVCANQNSFPRPTRPGANQTLDLLNKYLDRIVANVQLQRPLKVAVDCGNGIAGPAMTGMLDRLGCEMIPLYCEVDGSFPNHHPNPSVPENLEDLIRTVQKNKCDIGIALDGDGDRLGVVDDRGRVIWADRQMMLFVKDILSSNRGGIVIYDVKSSYHLEKIIRECGGTPYISRTGHSFIKAALKETGAIFAGEMSGHLFFNDRWFGFDDGVYAAARFLELLSRQDKPCSALCDTLPQSMHTPEINIHFAQENAQHEFMQRFISAASFSNAKINLTDGLRAEFEHGWGLIRASNTTPCLVIRFEANSKTELEQVQSLFRAELLKVKPTLNIPF